MSQGRELEQERRLNLLDRRLRLAEERIAEAAQMIPRAWGDGLGGGGGGSILTGVVTTAIPTGTISSPSTTGAVQIYHGGASSGSPVTVYNDHTLSASIATGKVVKLASFDGHLYLIAADC